MSGVCRMEGCVSVAAKAFPAAIRKRIGLYGLKPHYEVWIKAQDGETVVHVIAVPTQQIGNAVVRALRELEMKEGIRL